MFEMTCQNCGTKVQTESFIAAAQQPCSRCGRLLMGALDPGSRTVRPPDFGSYLPPAAAAPGAGSSAGMWCGLVAGVLAGITAVFAVAHAGPAIPPHTRQIIFGALTGVILAPIFAVTSFLSMLILPFSLEGILGDSVWVRIAEACNHKRITPLFVPFVVLVGFPMAVCGYGAGRMPAGGPTMLVSAAVGAMILGALFGSVLGSLFGGRSQE